MMRFLKTHFLKILKKLVDRKVVLEFYVHVPTTLCRRFYWLSLTARRLGFSNVTVNIFHLCLFWFPFQ